MFNERFLGLKSQQMLVGNTVANKPISSNIAVGTEMKHYLGKDFSNNHSVSSYFSAIPTTVYCFSTFSFAFSMLHSSKSLKILTKNKKN